MVNNFTSWRSRVTFRFLGFLSHVFSQFFYKFSVEVRVTVLWQLIENKPVSDLSLGEDKLQWPLDVHIVLPPDLSVQETVSDSMKHQGDQSVAEIQDRDGSKEEIPEPEDEVDLLIDNVLGQDTHAVMNLQVDDVREWGTKKILMMTSMSYLSYSRGSNIGNITTCDGRKHLTHWIAEIIHHYITLHIIS